MMQPHRIPIKDEVTRVFVMYVRPGRIDEHLLINRHFPPLLAVCFFLQSMTAVHDRIE